MIIYSKVRLTDGTIYSTIKGNKIERHGDTVIVCSAGGTRIIHIAWACVIEADYVSMTAGRPLQSLAAEKIVG